MKQNKCRNKIKYNELWIILIRVNYHLKKLSAPTIAIRLNSGLLSYQFALVSDMKGSRYKFGLPAIFLLKYNFILYSPLPTQTKQTQNSLWLQRIKLSGIYEIISIKKYYYLKLEQLAPFKSLGIYTKRRHKINSS